MSKKRKKEMLNKFDRDIKLISDEFVGELLNAENLKKLKWEVAKVVHTCSDMEETIDVNVVGYSNEPEVIHVNFSFNDWPALKLKRMQNAYVKLTELSLDELNKIIKAQPPYCPITGLKRCDDYVFDEGVVYLPTPAYNAYTLPEYDEDEQAFYRWNIDMDDGWRRVYEYVCDLSDLKDRNDYNDIKAFYGID